MVDRFRSAGLLLGALLSAGCGNGDDLDPYVFEPDVDPVVIRAAQPYPPRPQSSSGEGPVGEGPVGEGPVGEGPVGEGGAGPVGEGEGAPEGDGSSGAGAGESSGMGEAPVDSNACATPSGVSGSPRNLSEALNLMNSLPKPVSLACFLQALERPLSLYSTSSSLSLQPSPGQRSPRTFIVYEPLVMSIVFDGRARIALEFGYRTTPTRSVKTELLFPLETDVTFDNLFDDVRSGSLTKCGNCHTGEVQTFNPALLPVDVFESDIIAPFEMFEVSLAALRAERDSCDAAAEPERCALLSAVFDHGEVRSAPRGIMF